MESKDQEIKKLEVDKEQELSHREKRISELKGQIEKMSTEFTDMLKKTLTNMQQKIELANNQWENENDASNLKRIEEIASVNKWKLMHFLWPTLALPLISSRHHLYRMPEAESVVHEASGRSPH